MKHVVFATVALAFGACASGTAPAVKTPAEMILGKWTCKAAAQGISTDAVVTYLAGGAATLDAKIAIAQGGMAVDITATGEASWKFLADGKLEETITNVTVVSGKVGDNNVPPATIQPIVDQVVVNETSTGTVVFNDTSFTSTDEDGVVTTCTR